MHRLGAVIADHKKNNIKVCNLSFLAITVNICSTLLFTFHWQCSSAVLLLKNIKDDFEKS